MAQGNETRRNGQRCSSDACVQARLRIMGWGSNRGFNSPPQGCQSKQIVEGSYRVHSTGLIECITLGILLTFSNFSDTKIVAVSPAQK